MYKKGYTKKVDGMAERFCPISLGDWNWLCRKADVPYIPAILITAMEKYDLLNFDHNGPHQNRLMKNFGQVEKYKQDSHMMRWDFCADGHIKSAMANGEPDWLPVMNDIEMSFGDPRWFDILFDYPRLLVPVWNRPWVSHMIIDKYPVEYRVFVNDGDITGISSYYPQRPLPYNAGHLETVTNYTEILIDAVETPFLLCEAAFAQQIHEGMASFGQPEKPKTDECKHFTADFLVDLNDKVWFLEGGPPHELGAHPCCFLPGEIDGIALENRGNRLEGVM